MAGYSQRSLIDKLGLKPHFRACHLNSPLGYHEMLGKTPEDFRFLSKPQSPMDFIHWFVKERSEYEKGLIGLKKTLAATGMIWVSWPKGSSELPTDLNDRVIRQIGLKKGLVDIKVCAVDETWSGLKFVIPVKDRK
jgi:hypothetical protein